MIALILMQALTAPTVSHNASNIEVAYFSLG